MPERNPKILFLSGHAHRALDPAARCASGGAELQVALLAKALARRGFEAVLAAASDGFPDGVQWQGVRIRDAGRFDLGAPGRVLTTLPRVWHVLREEKPSLVVVYGWTAWLAILCAWRRLLRLRVGFVCALDSEIDGRFLAAHPVRGRLFAWGMRAADVRMAITDHQARLFREKGMVCEVVRLLLQKPGRTSPPSEKPVDVLWVARCHPVKRPHEFLDLIECLPGLRARMICLPQDRSLFESVRRRARAMAGLEFFEGVPYHKIQDHFDATKVFVNTSSEEGVPNTFLHAASAWAAIASLKVDPDGMIGHFQAGVCAEGDPGRLAESVRTLLASPEVLAAAAAGAARLLKEWHDNDRNLAAFLEATDP